MTEGYRKQEEFYTTCCVAAGTLECLKVLRISKIEVPLRMRASAACAHAQIDLRDRLGHRSEAMQRWCPLAQYYPEEYIGWCNVHRTLFLGVAARKIQRAWPWTPMGGPSPRAPGARRRRCVADPVYDVCRRRLMVEFAGMECGME